MLGAGASFTIDEKGQNSSEREAGWKTKIVVLNANRSVWLFLQGTQHFIQVKGVTKLYIVLEKYTAFLYSELILN